MNNIEIKVLPDPAAIAGEAAERFMAYAAEAIADHKSFSVALSGGSTPKLLHQLLAGEACRDRVDWAKVRVFFGDERGVPPAHADSNYRMAHETLLSRVPIPPDNVYRMEGEVDPADAANRYERDLADLFGDAGGLDLCLLGLGDDGHTASLFPGTPALGEASRRCVAQFVEKSTTGPSWRITLTAPFINRSRRVMFLVAGRGKAAALATVLEGERNPTLTPAQLIAPDPGVLIWLIDAGAAGMAEE